MSKSSSNSVKDSDECLVEPNPAKRTPHRHILRRHFSADVLGAGATGPGAKFPGNGPRNRLQKTGSRIFRELSPGHLLVSRMSDGNLLKDKVKSWKHFISGFFYRLEKRIEASSYFNIFLPTCFAMILSGHFLWIGFNLEYGNLEAILISKITAMGISKNSNGYLEFSLENGNLEKWVRNSCQTGLLGTF